MMLPNGALVAVVDGEKLVLFKNTGHETPELTAVPRPDIDGDGVGSGGHHSSGANPDNDTQAEDGFATGVAEMLNKRALGLGLDALLLIAAPKTLGEMRKHFHKALEAKIIGEIPKDLTGQTADQIAAAIARH
jgi:protein required for attachment to host cells